ncbi:SDR family NAD(P)-dependent oxidoreductase [Lignipirellula cremea]|uniref:L-2,3-butanediol dehydrogenase n=1 Tax=Lignipirellula cremea TaxID=2528010 RepID=A0A518DLI5_9BACT|nr:SDR family NAD(P)-dependent oxidoreductase [Lignipirellula cremea]QDU92714.1 L-2,3-butanediol dehydrogenase [Lignipirellula cremea]
MARRTLKNARALVTGASSGIGREIALELAAQGTRVLVTARREERLVELVQQIQAAGGEAHYVAGDITRPEVRESLVAAAADQLSGLDILVNNAGVGSIEKFVDSTEANLRTLFELDFFAAVEMIRVALPLLRQGERPLIANIASVLGHVAVPKKSEYCAAKFALHGFTDALRAELAPEKIDVSLICPSTTDSEFWESVLANQAKLPWKKLGMMSSAAVGRASVKAIRRGQREMIMTIGGKGLVLSDRLFPGLTGWLISRFG